MDERIILLLIFLVGLLLISLVESVIIGVAFGIYHTSRAIAETNVFGNSVGDFKNFAKTKVIITKASQVQISSKESDYLWELQKRNRKIVN